MTNRETLLALADRFEKAASGDRSLDIHIDCVVFGNGPITDGQAADFTELDERLDTPFYTASLDAAMTLAKDFGGEVTFFKDGTAKAYLWQPYPLAVECKKAATPALALCAASLRALATLDPTGEKA